MKKEHEALLAKLVQSQTDTNSVTEQLNEKLLKAENEKAALEQIINELKEEINELKE